MNTFKRNAFIIAGAIASLVLGLAPVVKTSSFLTEVNAGQKTAGYKLLIDSSNCQIQDGSYSKKLGYVNTNPGKSNNVRFAYKNAIKKGNHVGQFDKSNGRIYNTNAITNITAITVTFTTSSSDSPQCFLATGSVENPNVGSWINSGTRYTFNGDNTYFFSISANSKRVLYLESVLIEYSCTKYIDDSVIPTPTPDPESSESSSSETPVTPGHLTFALDASNSKTPNEYASKEIDMPASNNELVKISFKDAGKYNNKLQIKKSSGLIYNKDKFVGLSKIEIKADLNSISLYYGSTIQPNTNENIVKAGQGLITINVAEGNGYFTIKATDAYARIESLLFTFDSIEKYDPNQGGGEVTPPGPVDPDPTPGGGGQNPQPTPGKYEVPTTPLTGTYESLDIKATGATLLSQARDIMVSNHKYYSSYDNCRGAGAENGKAHITDMYPGDPTKVMDFYSHDPIDNKWNTIWNREHVWPKSLSNNNWESTSYGGSDLHHIRPNIIEINGKRSSMPFGDTDGTLYSFNGHDAAYIKNNVWEPLDFAKGDVARIILYCFVHYNTPASLQANDNLTGNITSTATSKGPGNPLPITKVMAGSVQTAFDTLLRWHELDPVDSFEIYRNNEVAKIQGNRNPFIDQPWIVRQIWG